MNNNLRGHVMIGEQIKYKWNELCIKFYSVNNCKY